MLIKSIKNLILLFLVTATLNLNTFCAEIQNIITEAVSSLTPLMHAIITGDAKVIDKELQQADIDINAKDSQSKTVLHHAVENNQIETVQKLLKIDFINVHAKDNNGYTPIMIAVQKDNLEIYKLIYFYSSNIIGIAKRIEPGHYHELEVMLDRDHNKLTALMQAAIAGKSKFVEFTLDRCLDYANDGIWPDGKKLELIDLAREANQKHIVEIIEREKEFNQLMAAIRSDNLNLAKHLLKLNFSSEKLDSQNLLHWCESKEMFKLLLSAGANINNRDLNGRPIFNKLIVPKWFKMGILLSNEEIYHLIESKADVNIKDQIGNTPLIEATQASKLDIMKCLIDGKADVNARNISGYSALDIAYIKGDLQIHEQKLLKANGACDKNIEQMKYKNTLSRTICHNLKKFEEGYLETYKNYENFLKVFGVETTKLNDLIFEDTQLFPPILKIIIMYYLNVFDIEGYYGISPLFIVLHKISIDDNEAQKIFAQMLGLGVNINKQDSYGSTALQYALNDDMPEKVIEMLLKSGADVNIADRNGVRPRDWLNYKKIKFEKSNTKIN